MKPFLPLKSIDRKKESVTKIICYGRTLEWLTFGIPDID